MSSSLVTNVRNEEQPDDTYNNLAAQGSSKIVNNNSCSGEIENQLSSSQVIQDEAIPTNPTNSSSGDLTPPPDEDTISTNPVCRHTESDARNPIVSSIPSSPYASVHKLSQWFPQVDPENKQSRTFWAWRSRRGVVLCTAFAIVFAVFVVNLVLTILSWTHLSNDSPDPFLRNLYSAECDSVKDANLAAHLLINILGTLMLAGSNMCLQLVAAPSREEVDEAHTKKIWLDIGVPSIRNLKYISKTRLVIWVLLAISSLPIHFLYNSIVIGSLVQNNYGYIIVPGTYFDMLLNQTKEIVETPQAGRKYKPIDQNPDVIYSKIGPLLANNLTQDYLRNREKYSNMSVRTGLQAYQPPFKWKPNLFAVTSQHNYCVKPPCTAQSLNGSFLEWGFRGWSFWEEWYQPSGGGLCDGKKGVVYDKCPDLETWNESRADSWDLEGYKIDYFLVNWHLDTGSEMFRRYTKCHLQCVPIFLSVVTLFNFVKCACILWFIIYSKRYALKTGKPGRADISDKKSISLCTLGDAIATFLESPDATTKDFGVTSKDAIIASERKREPAQAFEAQSLTMIRAKASSIKRWICGGFSAFALMVLVAVLVGRAIRSLDGNGRNVSLPALYKLGFGKPNFLQNNLWGQPSRGTIGLFSNVIIANMWQVLLSLIYFGLNSLLTSQLIAKEWSDYGRSRKALRVSHPTGVQRGSYAISLPLRYSLPMLTVFAILHWLISQSEYVISTIQFDWDGTPTPGRTISGFSVFPAIIALILGFIILISFVASSFMRRIEYIPGMPVVLSCSLAISANCHRPEVDTDAHMLPVQWGIVGSMRENGAATCSFTTAGDVGAPTEGQVLWGQDHHVQHLREQYSRFRWKK